MLFPYKYISHSMEKMQEFIDFIFYEVWCKAPFAEYGIHLFETNTDLYDIMDELFRRDLAEKLKDDGAAKFFYEGVNDIFNEFVSLTAEEITEYQLHFRANNDIEQSCAGRKDYTPVTYPSLNPSKVQLNHKLKSFYKNLYSSGFLGLSKTAEKIGLLRDYYDCLVRENDEGVCPFCGLLPVDGEFDPTREAFDHYLPKSKYPFNSVNLKNLAPSCNKCNSGNKRDIDPLHDKAGNRRKAFYPFSTTHTGIKITVSILHRRWDGLRPDDISVGLCSAANSEEIDTWKELYRIDQRYSARCCYKNGGNAWLNRIFNECQNYGQSRTEMFTAEIQSATTNPWFESNFLKKAFLEGCQKAGLFAE